MRERAFCIPEEEKNLREKFNPSEEPEFFNSADLNNYALCRFDVNLDDDREVKEKVENLESTEDRAELSNLWVEYHKKKKFEKK